MCTMPCSLRAWYSRKSSAVLQQGLADARDVAVAEDADRATKEGLGVAVALDALGAEVMDDGLADREPLGGVGVGH